MPENWTTRSITTFISLNKNFCGSLKLQGYLKVTIYSYLFCARARLSEEVLLYPALHHWLCQSVCGRRYLLSADYSTACQTLKIHSITSLTLSISLWAEISPVCRLLHFMSNSENTQHYITDFLNQFMGGDISCLQTTPLHVKLWKYTALHHWLSQLVYGRRYLLSADYSTACQTLKIHSITSLTFSISLWAEISPVCRLLHCMSNSENNRLNELDHDKPNK